MLAAIPPHRPISHTGFDIREIRMYRSLSETAAGLRCYGGTLGVQRKLLQNQTRDSLKVLSLRSDDTIES